MLATLGLLVAACATLPVLVGPHLNVAHAVEVADHLIPGLILLAVSVVVLMVNRASPISGMSMLVAGLIIDLASLWMVVTHIPLVTQAARDEAPWAGTLYHSASAVAVMVFGLVWTRVSWDG